VPAGVQLWVMPLLVRSKLSDGARRV
jgi:hypothetical protein